MRFEINFAVGMDFPRWVERLHDYVFEGDDDDE